MSIYVIKHREENLYWSNRFGWIEDGPDMDIFYNNDIDKRSLPMEGKWTLLKSMDNASLTDIA